MPHALRRVGVDVEIHDEIYDANASIPDEQWIEAGSKDGRVLILKDFKVTENPSEANALKSHLAMAFILEGNLNKFTMLRVPRPQAIPRRKRAVANGR